MKPGGGQSKGASFERDIAKELSLWLSNGEDNSLLWRTGLSGGRATMGKIQGVGYGDLGVLKPTPEAIGFLALFCIELKHYQSVCILKALFNEKNDIRQWWIKNQKEADKNNVYSILLVKANRQPVMVYLPRELFEHLQQVMAWSIPSVGLTVHDVDIRGFELKHLIETDWVEFQRATTSCKLLTKQSNIQLKPARKAR